MSSVQLLILLCSALYVHKVEMSRASASDEEQVASMTQLLAPNIGSEAYRKRATAQLQLEREIGLVLIGSNRMTLVAQSIRKLSDAMNLTSEDKEQQDNLINSGIGGAVDLFNGGHSMDACVLATHLKLDRHENDDRDLKDKVLKNASMRNMEPNRRTNRFNMVSSRKNPIWLWNCHNFDMDVAEIAAWKDFPEEMQNRLQARWVEVRGNDTTLVKLHRIGCLKSELGLGSVTFVRYIIELCRENWSDRKMIIHDVLGIAWSTTMSIDDELDDYVPRSINPVSAEVRQHKTGMLSNVVRGHDDDDPAVANWISGALDNMKPIISGPSGHTLRFLNHWAWVRKDAREANKSMDDYPSLADARLLMMANMMPPKNHHSYHEIMSASIGITDGLEELDYFDTGGYTDLRNGTELGQELFGMMNFSQHFFDTDLEKIAANVHHVPEFKIETTEELVKKLLQYGGKQDMVSYLLKTAGERVCRGILPLIPLYAEKKGLHDGNIHFLLQEILLLYPGLKKDLGIS